MTWREEKYSSTKGLFELRDEFNEILSGKYKKISTSTEPDQPYFRIKNTSIVRAIAMHGDKFDDLALEYADSISKAEMYDTEEGDLFPPDEFLSKDELFNAMLSEIEGEIEG